MPTLLHAVIDASGLSRRKAFAAIRDGLVTVDRVTAQDPSSEYEGGVLRLDGRVIEAGAEPRTYLLLNKPPGFMTTMSDEMGRRTVLDLVPPELRSQGLHPVGRLDRDTSGLLLLTNDGDFTYALTHPKHEVEKEYWARLAAPADEAVFAALRRGVEIDGQVRRPLRIGRLRDPRFQVSVTIQEGRNRQVRRLFESAGARVTALRRMREGPLDLGSLPEGAVRRLTGEEVEGLRVLP
ncbi:MAG: pseudouridine synthase [Dehalococcoidia bacterium]|nr:pseudouridine synthase [Dehalococcoidia bacterium]